MHDRTRYPYIPSEDLMSREDEEYLLSEEHNRDLRWMIAVEKFLLIALAILLTVLIITETFIR